MCSALLSPGSLIKMVYFSRQLQPSRSGGSLPSSSSAGAATGATLGPAAAAASQANVDSTPTSAHQLQEAAAAAPPSARLPAAVGRTLSSSRSFSGGRLHFVKFETAKMNECIEFIKAKQLHSRTLLG